MLSILIPVLGCSFLFQWLVAIQYDPLGSLAIIVVIGTLSLYGLHEWQNHVTDYLKGREMLILRFRLRKGKWFEDFALVKDWKLLNPEAKKLSKFVPEMKANPHDPSLYQYELTFEDFPYFDSLVMYSPVPKDDLIQITPQMVLWKNFITSASGAAISVVRLKEVLMGDEGIVPHVYPVDSDYEAERMLGLVGLAPINKSVLEEGVLTYEAVKYLEVKALYDSSQREIKTLEELLERTAGRSAGMAASLWEDSVEAGKFKTEHGISFGLFRFVKRHWKALTIIGVLMFFTLIIFYGGYIFGG